ncbi:hypothetical protein RDABS01_010237 [Bienertia sinuspersici]
MLNGSSSSLFRDVNFTQGDFSSITIMLGGLKLFSHTTSLHISLEKSEIYCTGMTNSDVDRVKYLSSFRIGRLPSKYLGVPIQTNKLSTTVCDQLVEKTCSKIKLVNSVSLTICNYWTQTFILPRNALGKVNAVCNHFLWHCSFGCSKPSYVKWEEVCSPKNARGLGVRNVIL